MSCVDGFALNATIWSALNGNDQHDTAHAPAAAPAAPALALLELREFIIIVK